MKMTKLLALSVLSIAGFAGVSATLWSSDDVLQNYQGTFQCPHSSIVEPSTIEEIQAIVRQAYETHSKVKVASRKFKSQFDAACTMEGGTQILLTKMNKMIAVDREKKTATVQAGMRFDQFNDGINKFGLAVNMVTELGTFTIGGMLGSATHGSTLWKPSNTFADYAISMKIVDGKGDVRVLIGEDLNAARVNLGVLGVVVEVTFQLENAFKVRAHQIGNSDDSDLENSILDIARNNYSANVAWFPANHRYAMTIYEQVPYDTPGDAHNGQAEVSDLLEKFYKTLMQAATALPGHGLLSLAARLRYETRVAPYFKDNNGKVVKENPIGYSYRMQYFDCKGESCIWDRVPIQLQEIAIPLEELPNWIADARKLVKKTPAYFPLNGIYFRFGKASSSYIGMNAGRDTAYVGIEFPLNDRGLKTPKDYSVNQELEQMTVQKYQGRPHWGKNTIAAFHNVSSSYPRWNDFVAFKKVVDPGDVFVNEFWLRVNNEIPKSAFYHDACVVSGECYCETDAHCGESKSCQAGPTYTAAKICM